MRRDIVAIGASLGGVEALKTLVSQLPRTLPAAVFVVLHTGSRGPDLMAQILHRAGDLEVSYPEDGESHLPGRIYLARSDHHLLLEGDRVRVLRGPKENGHRPAIDPLFRSAALHFGPRAIGVVLTGRLNDGASGLAAIKQRGGLAIVQDPADAFAPEMPTSALSAVQADHCAPLADLARILTECVTAEVAAPAGSSPDEVLEAEVGIASLSAKGEALNDRIGRRSTFTCSDCGGTLWEMKDDRVLRYRCHRGHALTAEVLHDRQAGATADLAEVALRLLEERAELARVQAAREGRDAPALHRLEARFREAENLAASVRRMIAEDLG